MSGVLQPLSHGKFWYETSPEDAARLFPDGIPKECAPINEMNEACPWPWDPEQLAGAPIGQYHCPYCGGMVLAGVKHLDGRVL